MSNSQNYHDFGPPSLHEQSDNHYNLGMLYCGFFVVATAGLILAIYHCVAVSWCTDYPSSWLRNAGTAGTSSNRRSNAAKLKAVELESSLFMYNTKEVKEEQECAVCLSVFEEGEVVRKLVRCKHCFHAPCIDMWLYSHFDCPLCRAPLGGGDNEGDGHGHGRGGAALSQGNSGARYSDSGVLPV